VTECISLGRFDDFNDGVIENVTVGVLLNVGADDGRSNIVTVTLVAPVAASIALAKLR